MEKANLGLATTREIREELAAREQMGHGYDEYRSVGPQAFTVDHADMVTALVKPGAAIRATMTPDMADMIHAAIGISGEAGELLDGVKKHVIYNKPLDRENIIEELGDLEFYMEQLRQRIGVTRDETLAANIAKLSVRYEGLRYSDAAAQNRADKA